MLTSVRPILLCCCILAAAEASFAGTTRFVLDGNRMYAELGFVRPDGSIHRALAFVDMGSPDMTVRESLFEELQIDKSKPLTFKVGDTPITVPGAKVVSEPRPPSSIGADLEIEALLPASILQKYQIVLDYLKKTLTLDRPGTLRLQGDAVPFRINRETGLIAVDASIDGRSYPITIDNGSAYTWVRQRTAHDWLVSYPDWERGVGAVGASNMMMSGDRTETLGTLMRIPEISLGSLILKNVGALAAAPSTSFPGNLDLFDWYSQKNVVPVIGWIGGNVLKAFRLTIDYPNHVMYWLKQADPDSRDLDDVGLTLRAEGHDYFVAAVATKNGKPTVDGVLIGDRLIRIGELDLGQASWGAIYEAMHGRPGESRTLLLERDGKRIAVATRVTAF